MPSQVEPGELLTVEQVRRLLKLSRAKTYELLAAGRLKSVKLDRCRRIAREDLEAFIEGLRSDR